ncbi:hypothetical protein DXG03_005349 [Asterophora parasitica]|uniref:Uncharacterized protein n=1 Tax=Asterophora parasitica TaxID=117018 RepID=A0A9P7K7K9_9AGAR|nr:hypothetical protein DXG03_005349 [Asterophora parasitica]
MPVSQRMRMRHRISQTFHVLQTRVVSFIACAPAHASQNVVYTGGAPLRRISRVPPPKRELTLTMMELALEISQGVESAYGEREDTWILVDDGCVGPVPVAKIRNVAYPIPSICVWPPSPEKNAKPKQFFYGKICDSLQELVKNDTDSESTCYCSSEEDMVTTVSTLTSRTSPNFNLSRGDRSVPAQWVPGDALPELAINSIKCVGMNEVDGEPVYATALAPPPRGGKSTGKSRVVPNWEGEHCPVHQCALPCGPCIDAKDVSRAPIFFMF